MNLKDFKVDLEVRKDFDKSSVSLQELVDLSDEIRKLKHIKLNNINYEIREVRVTEKRYNYYSIIIMLITDDMFSIGSDSINGTD